MKKTNFLLSVLLLSLVFPFAACKDDVASESSGGGTYSGQETQAEISLDKTNVTLSENESVTLVATTNSAKTVQWKSSNASVASVVGGVVRAKNAGTTTITATVEGNSASCVVTVTAAETSAISYIQLASEEIVVCVSDTQQSLQAKLFELSDGKEISVENAAFTYAAADESVATVDEKGVITPVAAGETLITVSCANVTATVSVDVYDETISTPQAWLGMFGTHGKKYLLTQDLDFSGVTYTGFCAQTAPRYAVNDPYFDNTVNGNGHTVKNVDISYEKGKTSSLFGVIYNAVIKNIAFENVTFHASENTLGYCSGIAFRAFGTTTEVCNVSLDLHFDHASNGASSAGLVVYPYAGTYKNVFIQMTTEGNPAGDKIYGISEESYEYSRAGGLGEETMNNSVPTLENVLVYSAKGTMKTCLKSAPKAVREDCVLVCSSKMDAAWFAYNHLKGELWQVSLTEIPALKGKA